MFKINDFQYRDDFRFSCTILPYQRTIRYKMTCWTQHMDCVKIN